MILRAGIAWATQHFDDARQRDVFANQERAGPPRRRRVPYSRGCAEEPDLGNAPPIIWCKRSQQF
eukprot:3643034-Pyramimonas_sp.AAC.1